VGALEQHHALGTGYHWGRGQSSDAGKFHLSSLPVTYTGRYGEEWALLLRASILFPLAVSDELLSISPRAEYESVQSFDMLLAVDKHLVSLLSWKTDLGLGPHIHSTRMRSSRYVEWSTAGLGLGISVNTRRSLARQWKGLTPEIGLHSDFSYDFIDLSRGGKISGAVQAQFLISLGLLIGDEE